MKIDKSDIETLDLIIDVILDCDTYIHDGILKKIDKYKDYKLSELRLESERIISILEFYNCAKIKRRGDGNTIEKNEHTKKFKEHGGFEKIYQDELTRIEKKEEIDSLSIKKLKWDTKLLKWKVKTFWPVFVFGLLGFIFGLYNFITQIVDSRKTKELQIELKNTQKEVSKLRTLVLDQKSLDSLRNSKNHVDSLNRK
jgi:hypothetical protein